jgi:hypothetical protein
MRSIRNTVLGLTILAATLAASSPAVQAQSASIARLVFFDAPYAAKAQFEDALKQQINWRREQKDPWRWLTWEYASGEVPRYCVGTFGHSWADFDQALVSGRAEEAVGSAAAALAGRPPTIQYFEHLKEVSDPGPEGARPTIAEISLFQLHYGKTAQFYAALREAQKAVRHAVDLPRYEWFELRSGGETPQFLLLLPRENWGALDVDSGLFFKRLEAGLGKRKANRVFAQLTSAVKTHQRWAVKLRPDLSLLPTVAGADPRPVGAEAAGAREPGARGSQQPQSSAAAEALARVDGETEPALSGKTPTPTRSPGFRGRPGESD